MEIARKVKHDADNGATDTYWQVKVCSLDTFNANGVKYTGMPRTLLRDFFRQPKVFCEFEEPNLTIYNRATAKGSDDYVRRINHIVQDNICGALSNPRIAADGRSATMEFRPWGTYANRLRELMNEDIPPKFAMRAMVNEDGEIDKIITWDLVG